MSETIVPTSGADLAAVVMNTTGSAIDFGVLGTFERWTGRAWVADGAWLTSLAGWGGFPVAGGPGNVMIPGIGLDAPAHSDGTVQYFSLPALSQGWYRVGYGKQHKQPAVYGVIRVSPAAPKPIPIDNPVEAKLTADPTLMQTSEPVGLVASPAPRDGSTTPGNMDDFNHRLATSVTIQRWDGDAWQRLATRMVHQANSPLANIYEVAVTLPSLRDGAYRIVRHSAIAGDLARVVWIDHSLPSTAGS